MTTVVLGRKLLQAATQDAASDDEVLRSLEAHDRFFCHVMENIPAAFYFPTDAEANWKKSAPKKYHKNVQAQKQQDSSKKNLLKRAKFSPVAQQSNEERQKAIALADCKLVKQNQTKLNQEEAKASKDNSLDGLRARLAVKIQAMREQRKAEEKIGKKRPSRAEMVAEQRAIKKRRVADNKNKAKTEKVEKEAASLAPSEIQAKNDANARDVATSLSYGSLLLDDGLEKDNKIKTRHGQSVRAIQNLLKKAERNAQRLEELKQTEEGKEKIKAKGWDSALQHAAGKVLMDDPKLLRSKLKKKEKAKSKSAKEWRERTAKLEVTKKERQKKKMANVLGRGKKDHTQPVEKKGRKGPRAGFEGKKGEAFLNSDKKGGKNSKSGKNYQQGRRIRAAHFHSHTLSASCFDERYVARLSQVSAQTCCLVSKIMKC
ncbi:Uncharacterized conserved protein [Plasmopara halstedii]|uniref:Uncharacterized conserved protein n=1 Tax=Plasmopara halstedii TaxID=4781 RepID=A0A0P1AGU8_PLAHL|nr:Uncharacterized conserved protein [Plasmopara halstedii]CEG40165.1 Uncharacterized conserved protein [Plasmopara halstedii]|eukprot:XP_024576534.1 Uncharacterized conserved protein [Plasmopara halstedii]